MTKRYIIYFYMRQSGESRYVSANDKFIAIGRMGGGGPVYVLPIDKPGRVASNIPMVAVHKGLFALTMNTLHCIISNHIKSY